MAFRSTVLTTTYGAAAVAGHRHGRRIRSLTGTFRRTEIAVPRARIFGEDGLGGPGNAERMMAAQLLGTGGIASLLLAGRCGDGRARRGGRRPGACSSRRFRLLGFRQKRRASGDGEPPSGGWPMSLVLDLLSITAIGAGAFFFFAGMLGLLRFPDALTRLHALTKADNLDLGLVVLGLLPRMGGLLAALKLVAIWALVQLAGATPQLIGRAVRRKGPTA
jgi:multicomponent Na+:H+ antiporter subunit G